MSNKEEAVRLRSRWMSRASSMVFASLVLVLVLEGVMAARADEPMAGLIFWLSYRLSMVFYLLAIWTMRSAFTRVAGGEPFDRVTTRLLARLGFALGGGALVSVLITPQLLLLQGAPRFGAFAAFDPPALTVGLVGLLLVVLSSLFSRAVAMYRELDEFF